METGDLGNTEEPFLDPPANTMPNPSYSVAGNDAGRTGNIAGSSDATKTDRQFVDQWITMPFHAAGIARPDAADLGLRLVPQGRARRRTRPRQRSMCSAGAPALRPRPPRSSPATTRRCRSPQQTYHGGESPDPLSPCPVATTRTAISTGTPLFALLPNALDAASTLTATVERDGVAVDSCAYDETSYTNPDADAQALGQQVLATRHQVVVVPKLPLVQGSVYKVSISVTYAGDLTPTVTSGASPPTRPAPTVTIGNASVVEGNARARQLKLTVSLSKPWTQPVQVAYATVAHTATAGSDFVPKSGTLTIPAGSTAGVITTYVNGDRIAEPQETFTVVLANPQNAKVDRKTGIATIINDDSPTDSAARVSIGSAALVEGNSGARMLSFAVTLSASVPTTAVTVHYETRHGTADSHDFTPTSGTLTIPARAVSGKVLIPIKPDTVGEDTEKFSVRISHATGALMHPTRYVATGTISDDD